MAEPLSKKPKLFTNLENNSLDESRMEEAKEEPNSLEELKMEENYLEELKVEQNNLEELKVEQNYLEELKVEQNHLEELKVEQNHLEELKVEQNYLEELKMEQCSPIESKPEENSPLAETKTNSKDDSKDDESMFPFPEDDNASKMLIGVDLTNQWPSVTDRYFTPFYKIDVQKPGDDICIRMHSNRICMISLAPSHSIYQRNSEVSKVDFRVSPKLDRTKNKVSGKGKHGAQPLQENSSICSISCADGEIHVIKCCMIGKLVEVNESLATDPSLLREPPHKGGYLAIVLPNFKLIEDIKKKLLTQENYEVALEERKAKFKLEELKEEAVREVGVEG